MKRSILLALMLTSISTAAFAQTPAPTTPKAGEIIGGRDYLVQGEMPKNLDIPASVGRDVRGGMGKHMENVWDEMDTNKDGAISKEESAAFGAKKFDERDINHDGKVTREEWDGFHAKRMEEYKNKMGNERGNMGGMPSGAMPPAGGAMPATKTAPAPTMTMEKK
jgi:hypothetical protein